MDVKVSVGIITYNHEKYIVDAIEGALCQETNFEYEIIIGDDCSTDGTASIVAHYKDKYPDQIRLVNHKYNLGPRKNFENIIDACRGEYIASLDGDDYWTDSNKLQRQSDHLDANPGLSVSFHPTLYVFDDGTQSRIYPAETKAVCGVEDILKENCVSSNTIMFRSSGFRQFPEWMHENSDFPGDLYILYSCLQQGDIGCLEDCMAVYRVHNEGIWSKLPEIHKTRVEIRMNRYLQEMLGDKYKFLILREGLRMRVSLLTEPLIRFLGENPLLRKIRKKS